MKRQEKATIWEARQRYDRDNQEAAALILRDPERYPVGSAMHMWAELVVNERLHRMHERDIYATRPQH